jgi:hypothetical protein
MLANGQAYESGTGFDVRKRQRMTHDNTRQPETIDITRFIGESVKIKCRAEKIG